jgi:hypothetical protein
MKYAHWTDVYKEFEAIVENNPVDQIDSKVEALYLQHEGDPVWDLAYLKWIEPSDDDEEEK